MNMKELRKACGATQNMMAETIGASLRTVQNWESRQCDPVYIGRMAEVMINRRFGVQYQAEILYAGRSEVICYECQCNHKMSLLLYLKTRFGNQSLIWGEGSSHNVAYDPYEKNSKYDIVVKRICCMPAGLGREYESGMLLYKMDKLEGSSEFDIIGFAKE